MTETNIHHNPDDERWEPAAEADRVVMSIGVNFPSPFRVDDANGNVMDGGRIAVYPGIAVSSILAQKEGWQTAIFAGIDEVVRVLKHSILEHVTVAEKADD
jgi:hypothetical protein